MRVPMSSSIAWGQVGREEDEPASLSLHFPLHPTPRHSRAGRPPASGCTGPISQDVWPGKGLLLSCLAVEVAAGLKSEHLVTKTASVLSHGERRRTVILSIVRRLGCAKDIFQHWGISKAAFFPLLASVPPLLVEGLFLM